MLGVHLVPFMVQWKMGVYQIVVTFQMSSHFPLNHDYGRKRKLVVWDSCRGMGYPFHNNPPFHKGIPGIQTTNPNHQITFN